MICGGLGEADRKHGALSFRKSATVYSRYSKAVCEYPDLLIVGRGNAFYGADNGKHDARANQCTRPRQVFRHVETAQRRVRILDWGVANATLEEVFIKFARSIGADGQGLRSAVEGGDSSRRPKLCALQCGPGGALSADCVTPAGACFYRWARGSARLRR